MQNKKNHIAEFIFRQINGDADKKHQEEFDVWMNENKLNKDLYTKINSSENFEEYYKLNRQINTGKAWDKVDSRLKGSSKFKLYSILKYAAILILPLAVTIYLLMQSSDHGAPNRAKNVITPGSQKAYLVLADGTKMDLEKNKSEDMFSNENVSVSNKSDILEYSTTKIPKAKKSKVKTNELIIPRGGEYTLKLSDGTKVILNSATKLRFPEVFDKDKRIVHLDGEAYFNVAHDKKSPFYVVTDKARIKVYGTSFNVNTHKEGIVRTVLVEGSVSMSKNKGGKEVFLKPNQLGELDLKNDKIKLKEVDAFDYISWTEDKFVFRNERLEEILHTLSLWYDTEIFWMNEDIKDIRFNGNLKRYDNITKILVSMEQTLSVRFKIKGNAITVLK